MRIREKVGFGNIRQIDRDDILVDALGRAFGSGFNVALDEKVGIAFGGC